MTIDLSSYTNSIRRRLDSDRQRRRLDATYDPARDTSPAGRQHRSLSLAQRQIGEVEQAFNAPGRADVRNRSHQLTMDAGTEANRSAFNEALRRAFTSRAQRGQLQSSLQAGDEARLNEVLADNQASLAAEADATRQAGISDDRAMAEQLAASLVQGGPLDDAAFQAQLAGVNNIGEAVVNQGQYQNLLARIQDSYRSLLSQSIGQGLTAGAGVINNVYERRGRDNARSLEDILASARASIA
jgi:hypothetical protein